MKGIILASHGKLAEGLLDSLKIFTGDPEKIEAICLMPGDDISEFVQKLKKSIEKVDTGEGVILFCDLLFGTPCNCGGSLFKTQDNLEKVQIITGMNLPMVLEYLGVRDSKLSPTEIIAVGKEGIVDFNNLYQERQS